MSQVVFVGAINVGKSSLVARFVKNEVITFSIDKTTVLRNSSIDDCPAGSFKNASHPQQEVCDPVRHARHVKWLRKHETLILHVESAPRPCMKFLDPNFVTLMAL